MAVMQNSLIFGDVNSADYGIYISGEGVFNAPKRDVEMVAIPGRNGEFALDKGRFENIEVTYPAFNFEPGDYDTFSKNLADFRNAICALRGYQRLTDTFHPEEYRMATYIGGLEIKPIKYNTASEFTIVFDCKPQRYLMSGEAAIEITSGDTLLNPTLFGASPLLELTGYGNINLNGHEIELSSNEIGEILIADATSGQTTVTFDTSRLLMGDDINAATSAPYLVGAYVTISGAEGYYVDAPYQKTTTNFIYGSVSRRSGYFDYGVPETPCDHGAGVSLHKIYNGNGEYINKQAFFNFRFILAYDGADTLDISYELRDQVNMEYITVDSVTFLTAPIYGESSKTIERAYIDCELGEAYCIDGGSIISLNQRVDLGSDLPKLASGANTITYDNTITELKIHPRWWKV